MSRTVTLCLQFPIVTTTLWGQLAGKTMTVLPAVCYYSALSCSSRSITPLHFLRIVEAMQSKNTTHLPGHGYPCPAQGLGEAVVTNDWCIIYSL